jgi:glycogen synthase
MKNTIFNNRDNEIINKSMKNMEIKNVVYCSFENRFAKSGGLAAVSVNILPYLKEINKISNVVLMTPLYTRIIDKSKLEPTGKSFFVPYGGDFVKTQIYKFTCAYNKPKAGTLEEYYLEAQGFFEAKKEPYLYYKDDSKKNDAALKESSLFFCKAVPLALQALGIEENILFHLQEWQTALVSLTSKEALLNGNLKSCVSIQTIHNPYDSFIEKESFIKILDESLKGRISVGNGMTAYQIGLQLTDAPISTVSDNFAKEFTNDILQSEYFAPHLQELFKERRIIGVNNGTFIEFSKQFPKRGKHTIQEIKGIKLRNRKELLNVLNTYKPLERFGELSYQNKSIIELPDNIPLFVMSGRLDPNQKGFDVFLQAIELFGIDEIKVILSPMPIREADLDYFREVAEKFKGNLTVFPIRMEKGYSELQIGSTFGVMPSIYEPFGAAIEYMVNGTVNIARATGGLVDQIEDNKCGLLSRETANFYKIDRIKDFMQSGHKVQNRKTNPWAISMADELYKVIKKAIDLYQNKEDEYYKLVLNGLKQAEKFGWEKSAEKYYQIYKDAVTENYEL